MLRFNKRNYFMLSYAYHRTCTLIILYSWMLYYAHCRYCDILHRASLHLGGWARLEGRSAHAPYNPWSSSVLWPQGALVKHNRELYRAEGITNAAEPGNTTHARLHVCTKFFSFLFYCDQKILCLD